MARIRSNVIYVSLLCLSSRLCKWSKSTQGRGKVTQALPLAQPASALKLRQAVIINEETWANGQEMQRYWLGWLPCSKPYTGWRQLGGLWFPRLLYVGGGGNSQGVKPGHRWQLSHPGHTWRTEHRRRDKDTKKKAMGKQLKEDSVYFLGTTHASEQIRRLTWAQVVS